MKQRIITALLWLPVVIGLTWWGSVPFMLMMLGFFCVGIWETKNICAAGGRGGDLKLLLPLKAMKFIFWMQRYGIYVLLVLSMLNILDLYLSVAQTTLFVLLGALMG